MIFSRYLFREILITLVAISVLLVMIYLSHRFMGYLVKAAAGNLPAEFILRLLAFKLMEELMLILPLSYFLAVLLALGRLYKDNEITALNACGLPVPQNSILLISLIMALLVGSLSLVLSPWARTQESSLKVEASQAADVSGIAAGRFKTFNQGQGVFYAEAVDAKTATMALIFAQTSLPGKEVILAAQHGKQIVRNGELYMVAEQGFRYETEPGSLAWLITRFDEHTLRITRQIDEETHEDRREALPTLTLLSSTQADHIAEWQWRLSLPLSVLLLGALAVPLSRTSPRQGQYARVLSGVLIYLVYNNLLNVSQKWVARGDFSPLIGVWWVHALLLLIILLLVLYPALKRQMQHAGQCQ